MTTEGPLGEHSASIDPDIDITNNSSHQELPDLSAAVLLAIAAGGAIGALSRYGIAQLIPSDSGLFPWATFITNILGCLAIGILMVALAHTSPPPTLLRPFMGVGVLGGFTTFSTYTVDVHQLLINHHTFLALSYAAGTIIGALLAVTCGTLCARVIFQHYYTERIQ
ncbi:MAG: fluoride efflux transporter CrcB [Mycobacteriaceae bacterium]